MHDFFQRSKGKRKNTERFERLYQQLVFEWWISFDILSVILVKLIRKIARTIDQSRSFPEEVPQACVCSFVLNQSYYRAKQDGRKFTKKKKKNIEDKFIKNLSPY